MEQCACSVYLNKEEAQHLEYGAHWFPSTLLPSETLNSWGRL